MSDAIKKIAESRSARVKRRDEIDAEMRAIEEKVTSEKRTALSEDETAAVRKLEEERTAVRKEIKALDKRQKELEEEARADAEAAETAKRFAVGFGAGTTETSSTTVNEPDIYSGNPGQRHSYFYDMAQANMGNPEARERIARHNKTMRDRKDERALRYGASGAEVRAISSTLGAGGEWIPPAWLEAQFIPYLRPGRVTADLCNLMPMLPGTNSINIPKVNTGTAVAQQTTQNSPIQQTDLATTSVQSSVITLAGGQTISMQLLEQSPLQVDQIVLRDLASDYARAYGSYIINAIATAGQSVPWTQATPVFAGSGGYYNTQLKAMTNLQTGVFDQATHLVMHPRRWNWILAQTDTANRPLVVPAAGGLPGLTPNGFNNFGGAAGVPAGGPNGNNNGLPVAGQNSVTGNLGGLPVVVDANIPTNLGAGTNQDEIFVIRAPHIWIWEGALNAQAFAQTYAQNLSLFVRCYAYVSAQAGRYPAAAQVITGTGAVTPSF